MDNRQDGKFDIQVAQTIGKELRSARQRQKMDVETVAGRLKLSAEQIQDLEDGDYSSLPDMVFVTGFLRTYARLLQLDEQSFSGRLKDLVPNKQGQIYAVDRQTGKKDFDYHQGERAAFPKWIIGAAVGILVGGGIYAWQNKSNQETAFQNEQDSSAVQNSMQTPALMASNITVSKMSEENQTEVIQKMASASVDSGKAASAEDAVPSVAPDELWIKVQYRSNLIVKDKDGTMVFSRIVPEGGEQRFRGGAPYDVWIGISAGAQANFGGTAITLKPYKPGARAASFIAGKK